MTADSNGAKTINGLAANLIAKFTNPASQMEYINALMRSLDGKSPEDIEKLLNGLPTDARTGMANTFQIASNGRVTASVEGNVDVPTNGGFSLLPQKMRDSLTRKDLVQYGSTMAGTQSTEFPISLQHHQRQRGWYQPGHRPDRGDG
ncbi:MULTISPECIES: TPR repeat region-containing protein [unclassified Mycolicibacterium]|uniref:TPR repeat region-containing protein n=1 Tax=unclassified Mycolicibacterium TaxID=2636767 RepID=UPI002EDA7809